LQKNIEKDANISIDVLHCVSNLTSIKFVCNICQNICALAFFEGGLK